MREKLIELLKKTPIAKINGHIAEAEVCFVSHVFASMADHLIANGVTIQKWIPVTERLPDEDGLYIVTACDEGCSYGEGIWYDTVVVVAEYYKGSWTWNENGTEYDLRGFVTHWMPLPEPPEVKKQTV